MARSGSRCSSWSAANPGQVAVTGGVASAFHLKVGDGWHQGGRTRTVTGIVENPQSLLDEFALVVPGQVSAPTQVSVLFDAPGASPNSLGPNVQTVSAAVPPNALNPESISIAALTVGMLLITLVAVGGFTVLAQRRLRSLGMLASLGATDSRVRLVVRANGVIVGVIGAVTGAVVGLAAWLAYRPLFVQGAAALLRRGADRVAGYADAPPHGIDAAGICRAAREMAARIDRDGAGAAGPLTARLVAAGP